MAPRLLAVACALLVLVACTVENTADKSKAKPTSKGEIRIGVDLPLSGGEAVDGRSTLNGVKFAVQQANDRGGVAGFHLSVREFDDAVNGVHNPARGGDNVKRIIADGTILGTVGPLESNVAQVQIPIANEARLAMISPAAVNECLTKNLAYCRPGPAELRPSAPNNFFRVSPTSDLQGPAMADYALDRLKLQRVAVASDGEIYGKSLANSFADRFTKRGGKVVRTENF